MNHSDTLIGRSVECAALDRLLEAARNRQSGALVLRGEPGVGKTALLGYAAERAEGFRVLRATGIETESELAFAAVHQLVGGDPNRIDRLPEPQANALRAAFGLAPLQGSDPFLISLAVLTLLAELAEESPVLCLIDDAQWLDDPSGSALLFAARRIEAEGITMLFTVREGEQRRFDAPGLPSLTVQGLDTAAAGALLERGAGAGLAAAVRERLVEETAGNALALIELPATLTQEQLTGREPLAAPLPIGEGLQTAYLSRLHRLPEATQSLLLYAAAEDSGEVATILRAAATAELGAEALEPAERDGLVSVVDGQLAFRHPLVRSSIYQGATFSERRLVHEALAGAQDETNQDRRAWHLAAAAAGPDEAIARELEQSAERATLRGGFTAAASALEKAAGLSAGDKERTTRLLAAADAAWLAGRAERARALLADAGRYAPTDLRLAVTHLRARIEVRSGVFRDAIEMLVSAGESLTTSDPAMAIVLLGEAQEATMYTGDIETIVRIGLLAEEAASRAPGATDPFLTTLAIGIGRTFSDGVVAAAPLIRECLELASGSTDVSRLLSASALAMQMGDDEVGTELVGRAARIAREAGAVGVLPLALERYAFNHWRTGRYSSARMYASEGLRLAQETGQETGMLLSVLALVGAVQGREDECRSFAHETFERARERGAGLFRSTAAWAVGLLELGLGRFQEAAQAIEAVLPQRDAFAHPGMRRYLMPDYIEASVRGGERDGLDAVLGEYEQWVIVSGTPAVRALLAHCRGLMSSGEDAEAHFLEALDLHPASRRPFDRARSLLALGEVMRRNRKRREAREYLREAIASFEDLGATPWEQRARNELRASGETARKRDPSTLGDLTPQELQIARLVAAGARNREVAAQLFLSPRTIDYHLRKVFMKLGISSRAELARLEIGAHEPALASA